MIYLDNAANTTVDPRVLAAMQPYWAAGNPSSMHRAGQQARAAMERARLALGSFFQCEPTSFVFTRKRLESGVK